MFNIQRFILIRFLFFVSIPDTSFFWFLYVSFLFGCKVLKSHGQGTRLLPNKSFDVGWKHVMKLPKLCVIFRVLLINVVHFQGKKCENREISSKGILFMIRNFKWTPVHIVIFRILPSFFQIGKRWSKAFEKLNRISMPSSFDLTTKN